MIVAARRDERLRELADELTSACACRVWPVRIDLSAPGSAAELISRSLAIADERDAAGPPPAPAGTPSRGSDSRAKRFRRGLFGLVNNAGVTFYGRVTQMSADELARIATVNVTATLELTRLFLAHHAGAVATGYDAGPDAAVLTITSLAAHLLVPYQAAYAASKHALQAWSETTAIELAAAAKHANGPRVVMTAFAPGGIQTEMIERSGLGERFPTAGQERSPFLAPAERVARQAVRSWRRERRAASGGFANRLAIAAGRVLPRRLLGAIGERLYRPEG